MSMWFRRRARGRGWSYLAIEGPQYLILPFVGIFVAVLFASVLAAPRTTMLGCLAVALVGFTLVGIAKSSTFPRVNFYVASVGPDVCPHEHNLPGRMVIYNLGSGNNIIGDGGRLTSVGPTRHTRNVASQSASPTSCASRWSAPDIVLYDSFFPHPRPSRSSCCRALPQRHHAPCGSLENDRPGDR